MTATLNPQITVGQLVAEKPSRARVFETLKIDYCCGGKLPLEEACAKKKINTDDVIAKIAESDAANAVESTQDWKTAPLGELCDHIVNTHHAYLREELPRLDMLTEKVANVHGYNFPEMKELREVFVAFREELEMHAMKEESILFPWIKTLESGNRPEGMLAASVASPIQCMEEEHDNAGNALESFRELTNGFQPPAEACNTWRVLYASLEQLEGDMHQHVHKENNILFPRSLELEQTLA